MRIGRITSKTIRPGETDRYNALLAKTYSVCRADTEIVTLNLPRGLDRVTDMDYSYFLFLNKRELVECAIQAERDGFDAVVINSFTDAGVKEARAIVDIPVVSVSESSMMYATLLGDKFAIIIPGGLPFLVKLFTGQIRERGLEGRVIHNPVRAFEMPIDELMTKGWKDPALVTAAVAGIGRELVREGAEVLICGSTYRLPPEADKKRVRALFGLS